jgi:hypothetical protein
VAALGFVGVPALAKPGRRCSASRGQWGPPWAARRSVASEQPGAFSGVSSRGRHQVVADDDGGNLANGMRLVSSRRH